MDEFNLVVIKDSTEEVTGREARSTLEKGREHYSLDRNGCGNIFPTGRMPLQDYTVWGKVIHDELADFTFIYDG
jgi:hypothetical protein